MSANERDADIIRLANTHVTATRHVFRLFSSQATAYRRTKHLRETRQLRVVGQLRGASGRPEYVYCNTWNPKADALDHELLITDFFMNYPDADVIRGWIVNRQYRPDAEFRLDGYFYYLELHTGKQSYAQVQRRQVKYTGNREFILYVTTKEKLRDGLIRNIHDAIRQTSLFSTLDLVQKDPRGSIWIDAFGEATSI
jgi:hypothetical protein